VLMSRRVRKLALAIHLTCSVGWIGAVAAYLPLDIAVATSSDPQTVRAAWIAMGLIASTAIVPLSIASLGTGVIMALGTRWGLIRHWWVLVSLMLTVFATVVLLVESGVIARAASLAADPITLPATLLALPGTLPHSVGGLLILLVVQVLNVSKPRGVTPYGWRRQQEERGGAAGR
jgi:hypothetical protein